MILVQSEKEFKRLKFNNILHQTNFKNLRQADL